MTSIDLINCDGPFNFGMGGPFPPYLPVNGTAVLSGQTGPGNETVTYTHNGSATTTDTFKLEDENGDLLTFNVTITSPTYTVTYNGNGNTGGSVPTDGNSPYASGATVTVLGNTGSLTRTGYTFDHWNTAANNSGTSYNGGNTFSISANTTLYAQWTANPPTATTGSASSIGFNGATLGGTVNDNGLAVTAISFDYGTTVAYGSTATATPSTLSAGAGATAVSASITSLTCGTTYHFRVKATSTGGTTNGSDNTFTTSACAVPGAPTMGTATAGDTQATVTFSAPASDGGATITGYTATSSPGGLTGTCAASPCTVTGLTNGTAYTFTVTATNSTGTGSASAASNSVTPQAAQTITFSNPGAQNFGTTPTLSATASSGLTVSFTSSTTSVCTITTGGTLTFLTAGTCTINADQAGSAAYSAAPTVTQSFAVNALVPGAPTIGTATAGDTQASVTFSAPASNGGATITGYTATSSPGGLTGTCASSPCTVTGLSNGTAYTFTVTATNSAGTGSASAASNSVTPKAAQTITFSNPGAQNFGTSPTLTATASSGLTVSFTSSTTSVCTITTGGALTFLTTGTCTINADQAGNAAYSAAPTVTHSFAVNAVVPGAPTIGTATAGNAQATVTFSAPASDGGAAITGYTATSSPGGFTGTCASSPCTVTGLTNGTAYTFSVAATNSAGTSSASAASNSVTPVATVPGAPTIGTATAGDTQATVTFSAPASDGGATITGYTATSSPGGLTGTCAASPCTVTGLTNGTAYTFTVTATNSTGTGSASAASNSVTPQAAQTITFSNPGAQNFGTTPTLSATASSGLTVSFTSSTTGVCTVTTGGALTFVTAGTCTINADQAGNAAYSAAPTVTQSFAVNALVPGAPTGVTATGGNTQATVTFSAPASNGGAAITTYTATSSPGGLTGTCAGPAACAITVAGLTNGTAYTFTVTATNSAGTGSASSASNSVTPIVGQTITFSNPGAQNFGSSPTLTATSSSGLPVSFTSSTTGVCTITTGGALTFLATGTCTINADQAGNAAYSAAPTVTQSFAVNALVPGAPTGVAATGGNTQATVTFTAPASNGGAAITTYTATSSPGGLTGTCAGPAACAITVAGLTNGTAYTFTVTATNAAGTSAPSAASAAITPTAVPTAGTATMSYQLNTQVTLDLAPYITGTAVSVTVAPAHGTVTVSGTQVTYTPATNFFGSDSFTYVAINGLLTSSAATVTIGFTGARPDPTRNSNMTGMVRNQMETGKRFARAQIANFQQRLEFLHRPVVGGTSGENFASGKMSDERPVFGGHQTSRASVAQVGGVAPFASSETQSVLAAQSVLATNDSAGAANFAYLLASSLSGLTNSVPGTKMAPSITLNVAQLMNLGDSTPSVGETNIWGAGNIRVGTKAQPGGGDSIDYSTDGVSFGSDRQISKNLTLGVGVGYAHDKSTIGTDGTGSVSNGISVAAYGSYRLGHNSFIDGLIGYGWMNMDSTRYISGFDEFAKASRGGDQWFGSLIASHEYRDKLRLLSPYIRYDFVINHLDSMTERGGDVAALHYSSQKYTSRQISLGLRGEMYLETNFGLMLPRARVEYQRHIEGADHAWVAYADTPGATYNLTTTTANSNGLMLGVGSGFQTHNGLDVDVSFQWLHATGSENSRAVYIRISKQLGK